MLMSNAILIDTAMLKVMLESIMLMSEKKKAVNKTVLSSFHIIKLKNILTETQICKTNLVEVANMPNKWQWKIILTGVTIMKKTLHVKTGTNHGSVEKSTQLIQITQLLVDVKEDYGLD